MKASGTLRSRQPKSSSDSSSEEVVGFWRASSSRWFVRQPAFDTAFRERFLDRHMAAAARRCDEWMESPSGALALLILTDQFPRNAFRDTAHMYATDMLARHYARQAIEAGQMDCVEPELRLFFCLPFAHSEELADQELSVTLNARLGQPWLDHAEGHHDIIRRFGRFPHRNPMLGRATTAEEAAFLQSGGFSG